MAARRPKPKATHEILLDQARIALAAGTKYKKKFAAYDAKAKITTITPAFLSQFATLHTNARTAVGGRAADVGKQKRATAAEQSRRDALYTALTSMREKVNFAHQGRDAQSKTYREAFGSGKKLVRTSTPNLREASAFIEQGYESDSDVRAAGRDAGVTPALIKELTALRQAMTADGTTQASVAAQKIGATATRGLYLRELSAMKARLLSGARLVFKGNAAVLAEFIGKKPAPPRTKKRAKKKTTKPAPTTTVTTPTTTVTTPKTPTP
jgi:hypothetical protein